jgi:hypothetical protein
MKTPYLAVFVTMMLSACGGDDGETFAQPNQCNPEKERVGTYLLQYSERSGTCGPIDDALVQFGAANPSGSCEHLSEPIWSEGDCKFESVGICVLPADDQELTVTGQTTQMSEDGSRLEGTIDMLLRRASTRDLICHSLYSVTYSRQ